ncbi:MAG: NAD-dependent succinate-semialdehyde dehydrogenase [Myxococcales bacterium]|nr:NAD-dependent succinate-semialdehyde dehydrogenase [Myxococcales bacterium]
MLTEFRSVDPSSGRLVLERPEASASEVDAALTRSAAAFRAWSEEPIATRAASLRRLGATLRARAERDGMLMAEEMGKPVAQGKAESEKCALACEHAAEHAAAWLAPEPVPTEARASYVRHDPVGPILAIMPWNFPFWQLFRFGASALAAGNTIVLKHAPNVPRCAEAIVAACAEADLPEGLILSLFARVDQLPGVIADDRIAAVTLTGSTRAGKTVAELAARALKPSVLELGGSDAFIVLADADLDQAAEVAARARLLNNGQSCIAAKRFIVERAVADDFVERFRSALAAHRVGDPRDPTTQVGPMALRDLRDELAGQVARSVAAGARVLLGAEAPARDGWWYPPTLLLGAGPGMAVWDEETFGPAAAVHVVEDARAAVRAANASPFGLGAAVWTADREQGARMAVELRCGAVFVNDLVRSDPRMPFGGTKQSGWGRELGREGMLELTDTKSVWIS